MHLAASNPLSTQDDIAAALAGRAGGHRPGPVGVDRRTYYEHIHRALDCRPDLVIDDGCDLVNTLHDAIAPSCSAGVRGGCEATSTGVARLRRMAADGTLGVPDGGRGRVARSRRMIDH